MYKIILHMCICALLVGCSTSRTNNRKLIEITGSDAEFVDTSLRGTAGVRPSAKTNKRVALVIGNGAYENESKLRNPPNDAADVARKLSDLGFQVTMRTNLTRKQMRAEIAEFGHVATNAEVALFFYAGHAVQNNNQNFLLPVDVSTNSLEDVIDQGINLSYPLAELSSARSMVNIVMLDACRTPQFTLKFRGSGMLRGDEQIVGLAKMNTQPDTMIVYATQPGNGAVDSIGGRNSPFTTGLLAALNANDLSLGGVLKTTSKRVKELTQGYQVPYTDGPRTLDDFQFAAAATPAIVPTVSTVANSPIPVITQPDPAAQAVTQQTQAEAARLADLEAKSKAEEARIAELRRKRLIAEQAAQRAQAEAERLAAINAQRQATADRLAAEESQRQQARQTQRQLISGRYQDNGDGTVTDVTTKLMWKRCAEGQSWTGSTCSGEGTDMTWDVAMPNVQQKTWDAFAGYSDWQVPTIEQLRTLVWCSNGTPQEEAWNNFCSGKNPTFRTPKTMIN